MTIANIVFQRCSLKREDRSIVQVGGCGPDATEGTVRLHHVTFRNNSLDGARGISVDRRACSAIEMVDVDFSDNVCGDGCFGSLSSRNTLRRVVLERNVRLSLGDAPQSLMLMPPESDSSVSGLASRGNGLSSIRVDNGEMEITEAEFEENRGASAIVLNRASRVRIADSAFRRNDAVLSGAAILSNVTEQLTLSNCSFESNAAESGGAVASTNTDLRIRRCSFRSNVASDRGGAIFIEKNVLNMRFSVLENNSASTFGGALYLVEVDRTSLSHIDCGNNTSGNGGCLQSSRSGELVIKESVFYNNTVTENGGGAQFIEQKSAVIQEVRWTNNTAKRKGGGFSSESSNITSQASLYISNRANSGAGFSFEDGTVDSDEDLFSDNSADTVGGAVASSKARMRLRNCMVIQNRGHRGGGIDVLTSETVIQNVTFAQNFAHTSRGGGLACHQGNMSITNSRFISNAAINSGGAMDAILCGPILARNLTLRGNRCESAGSGGGISLQGVIECNILRSDLRNNTARIGGAMHIDNSTVFMQRCSIESNMASNGAGLSVYQRANVMLENSTVLSNRAGILGGGIYSHGSTFSARDVTFRNNSAGDQGGALFGDQMNVLTIEESIINNSRSRYGAGIFGRVNSSVTIRLSEMQHNLATEAGGGVHSENSVVNVRQSTFSRNKASIGGSLLLAHSNLQVDNASFLHDEATQSGGSMALTQNSSAALIDVFVKSCAARTGGGITLSGSSMTSSELWISACHAEVKGGGVFADRSSRFLSSGSSFSDNVAGEHGGGIAFESDVPQNLALQLNECAFNYNRADLGGALNHLRSSILNTHVCRCCPCVYWIRTEKLFPNQCFVHIRRRNWLRSLEKQRRRCRWRHLCARCQYLALLM